GTVCQSLYDGKAIFLLAQWWIHFCKGAVSKHRFISQCEMMGRCFSVEISSHALEYTDQFYRTTGTDMLDYRVSAGSQSEQAVPGHERDLRDGGGTIDAKLIRDCSMIDSVILDECGIFFMQADRNIQFFCSFHSLIEEGCIFQRDTIVGKTTRTSFSQRSHICHFLAFERAGDACCLINTHCLIF